MPTTNLEGPNSHGNIGTDIGDGVNYASISTTQRNRVLETSTGANAMAATSTPSGVLFTNFFNASQIPAGATILGVEVVFGTDFDGSGNSNIGSFGSSTGTFDVECYLYNGTSYSSKLTFLSTPSGVTLSNSDTTAEFNGANKRYVNNTLGDDVGFGGTADLAGLSWDPADQANFGFAITFQNESSGMVAGITRGFGLRVTYSEGTIGEKLNTIISGSVAKLDDIVGNTIAKFNNIVFVGSEPPAPPAYSSSLWDFEDQTTQEGGSSTWSPSGTHSDWVTGTSAVSSTYWGQPSGTTDAVRGWHLGFGTTTSGNTGPSGGYNGDGSGGHNTSNGRYMYTETSSPNTSGKCFVSRTPGINYSTNMEDTSNNLDLKFWLHAYGSNMGDLYIYIDNSSDSNHSDATLLQSYTSFTGFTANNSAWQEQTISLNSYRSLNDTYYIYFIYQNNTSFRGDLCIDNVQFVESS